MKDSTFVTGNILVYILKFYDTLTFLWRKNTRAHVEYGMEKIDSSANIHHRIVSNDEDVL